MANMNKYALYAGYLRTERWDTLDEAKKAAEVELKNSPNQTAFVVQIQGVYTGDVTVKETEDPGVNAATTQTTEKK